MKSVLLTGATGFIGSCAINPLLERGFEVHAISSKSELPLSVGNVTWHRANLLNFSETEHLLETVRPTHLLHFAWYLEHGKAWHAPENLDWLGASLNLVRNFNRLGGKRLVICGTLSEYAAAGNKPLLESEAELTPDTLYGTTKKALFEVVEKYIETTAMSFAWGRAFFQFGKNESPKRLVASVICDLLEDRTAKTSHGNQVRDYMSAEETAAAFAALLDSDVRGAVNIGSGEVRTIREIVLEIAGLLEKPADKIEFGAIPVASNEPQYIVADVTRLRQEVKWKPARSFSERLQETVNWWKENRFERKH
jgi:nucleoside-diphosphate-sugar epimerase